MYRYTDREPEVLLVHPGGPYWKNKNEGTWSIPKGEYNEDEEPLAAAKREFEEELGVPIIGKFIALKPVKQNALKIVTAWAVEGDMDADNIISNTIQTEWPPKSGKIIQIPEVDRACWFSIEEARKRLLPGQVGLLNQLEELL